MISKRDEEKMVGFNNTLIKTPDKWGGFHQTPLRKSTLHIARIVEYGFPQFLSFSSMAATCCADVSDQTIHPGPTILAPDLTN